jgi:hypothetical protein
MRLVSDSYGWVEEEEKKKGLASRKREKGRGAGG